MAREQSEADELRTIGAALRSLRQRRGGITQQELSRRSGISTRYLSELENGHRSARLTMILRLLRALDADLHQLADAIKQAQKRKR